MQKLVQLDRNQTGAGWNGSGLFFRPRHADALLVTHLPNIAYLCGFTGSNGVLLVEASGTTLFTDSRYTFQARDEVHDATTSIVAGPLLTGVSVALKRRRGIVRLGFSPVQLSVAQKLALDAALLQKVRWVEATNAVERLRAIKDAHELAAMRAAAQLIDDGLGIVARGCKARRLRTERRRRDRIRHEAPRRVRRVVRNHHRVRPTLGLGSRPPHVQAAQEKRVGRHGPGCYTPQLLQRYDSNRLPGARFESDSPDVPRCLELPGNRESRHPPRNNGWSRGCCRA